MVSSLINDQTVLVEIPASTVTPDQCRPGSNGYEKALYILQSSKTGASESDAD